MTDIAAAKAELRANARALRAMLPDARRAGQSRLIAERLLRMPEVEEARTVMAYGANAEEVDPRPAVIALREAGARIAYPRISGPGCLSPHWVDSEDEQLTLSALGISEPIDACACAEPSEIEIVLVPGVAFGRDGYRLGFGAGYYDRFLPRAPDALKIGLAFDEQLFDSVPHDAHDVVMDAIVTPSAVIR